MTGLTIVKNGLDCEGGNDGKEKNSTVTLKYSLTNKLYARFFTIEQGHSEYLGHAIT